MKLRDLTGLGRAIDTSYPTNRAIALIMGAAAFAWAVGTADIWQGLRVGLDVFFAWALCRELDPDHDLSAFLAVALVLVGVALAGPSTGPLFWVLLVVRVVNRTTGLSATLVDSALVLYLGITAGSPGAGVYGALTACAFAMDALLVRGKRRQWFFAVAALVLSYWYPPSLGRFSGTAIPLTVILLAALFLPVCYASGRLASVDDTAGESLDPTRVRCGQLLALAVGVLGTTVPLLPLWAAITAASLWSLGSGIFRQKKSLSRDLME